MKPETPKTPRQELEASLTALLLGELPAEKAVALRELMAKDPELARLYERLEQAIGLVRETTTVPQEEASPEPALQLSGKKREELLAHFKTVAPKEFAEPKRKHPSLVEIAAMVAILAILAAALLPALSKAKTKGQRAYYASSGTKQVDVLENSRDVTATLDRNTAELGKGRFQATAHLANGPATDRTATEKNLHELEHQIVAINGSAAGGSGGRPWQTVSERQAAENRGEPQVAFSAGKPSANQIVLPATTDYEVNGKDPSVPLLASTNYITNSGEPQWAGMLERGNYSAPGHSSTNAFVSEFAFNAVPTNGLAADDVAGLFYLPRVPVFMTNAAAPNAAGFTYYLDLNRNGPSETNGTLKWGTFDASSNAPVLYASDASLAQVEQRGGTVEQLSRSKLQEGVRNSFEKPREALPPIDPATGLPLPAANLDVPADGQTKAWSAVQSGVVLSPNFINGENTVMRNQGVGSAPEERLAELFQKNTEASGSNIYLGTELAKADVKFRTWALNTDQNGALPATKNEEEKLKQVGEVANGAMAGGRGMTPQKRGFAVVGPTETPPPSTSPASERVPTLGDLPMLGNAFRDSAEGKPGLATSPLARRSSVAEPSLRGREIAAANGTNATQMQDAKLLFEMGRLDDAEKLLKETAKEDPDNRAAAYYLNLIKDRRYRGDLNGKELVTRQAGSDIEKNWLEPAPSRELLPGQNPAVDTNAVQLAPKAADDVALVGGRGSLATEWDFGAGTTDHFWSRGGSQTNWVVNFTVDGVYGTAPQMWQETNTLLSAGVSPASNLFTDRLREAGKGQSYERYAYYRNLEQLGLDGEKEPKLALSYTNVRDNGPTNVAPQATAGGAIDKKSASQLEAKLRGTEVDVKRLRDQNKIPSAVTASDASTMLMSAEALRKIEGQRIEVEAQVMQQEALLAKLKEMPREKLVASLPTTTPDAVFSALLEQRSSAEQQLIVKQKELGESNPQVTRLRSQLSDLNSKIDRQADGILNGLQDRVAVTKEQLSNLRDEVERAKTNDLAAAKQAEPYWEARRKLDDEKRLSQVLAMKIASENIESSLPMTTMVEIMDPALPATSANAGLWDRLRGKGKFESLARIKVDRDQSDVSFSTDPRKGTFYDPYFIQNEFETIKSDKVLGKVVEEMDLRKEWSKGRQTLGTNEAIALLKQKLDLKAEDKTSFIDIRAKSDKPQEAAELANAVAKSYQGLRQETRKQLSLGGIEALEQRWKEQEVKVADAQKEVDRLRAETALRGAAISNVQAAPVQQVDAAPPKPATPPLIPQPEVQTRENAFSTFSLNVSDVAFKLAAASLEKGQMPEPASIRSEEFINAFDYRDPEAPPGVPVAFAWERARYPYAQNRDLLRFSIKTAAQGRQAGRPLNIVLLLDNSGSMERADRVAIIREALKVLASQLQPQDKLSVITFARTAQLRVDGAAGNQAAQVAGELSGLTPEGGTNIEDAMNLAYQTALRHYLANGINRVVLLTDGAANLGNVEPESLKQKVETNRKQGIALDCFGIGWEGYNDDLLEILSRNGDGRYGFINSPEEAATQFAGQLAGALNVAASDVKVQVEFNPARVAAYRQIGYAKHQLTKEQFRDNTVDAAEIAAQEAGNALYVIEANPTGEGPLGTVRVRFKIPGTSDYREHEWTVPFNGNAVALEQASPAMRLATAASAFSEWLANSPYATEVTPDTLLRYLGGVPEVYGADARPKKLEWMIRQAKSVVGSEIRNSNVETRSNGENQNLKSEARSKGEEKTKVQFP